MATKLLGSVISLITRVLGRPFSGVSWANWWAVLKAAFALPLTDKERAVVKHLTQRDTLPTAPVRELWLLLGRHSGKSIIAAVFAVWATCCRSYTLAPGEVGVFMVIAADRKQARVIKRYVAGLLRSHPSLEAMIASETAEAITLTNGLVIEIHTCSFRSLRGYTCIGAACDEVAFWSTEDSANPDKEVLVALRASMASQPEALLVCLTSPYARRGEPWRMFDKHFGKDSPDALVVNGPTQTMNPTISAEVIAAAYDDDPIAAAAEYGAEFRRDVERLITPEALEAVVVRDRYELAPLPTGRYWAFVDPSGGAQDSMTIAVAHSTDGRHVLDAVREVKPPFSPEQTVADFAALLRPYRITTVTGDRYAGEWPREQFRKHGITYEVSDRSKSDLYRDTLPLLNSGRLELLDHTRLLSQLASLERRTARGGRDSIDHAPGGHDDVANAVCGALVKVATATRDGGMKVIDIWTGELITGTDERGVRWLNRRRIS